MPSLLERLQAVQSQIPLGKRVRNQFSSPKKTTMSAIIAMSSATKLQREKIMPSRWLEHSLRWSTLSDVCNLFQLDIKAQDGTLDALFQHRRLKPGDQAYGIGQVFEALYVVNAGFLKTVVLDSDGNERVVSFPMKGDLLGSDGIYADRHANESVALSDCDLIVIPFKQLLSLGHACQELEHIIYRIVSRQIVQDNNNLAALGSLRSDARVARFLAMEADRHAALKFSSQTFTLRMTRREIGSYLGLTLETVSRSISALDAAGIISADQRDIKILEPISLRSLQDLNTSSSKKSHKLILTKLGARPHKVFPSILPKVHSSFIKLQSTIS
jgi:CRP/FNR family transcriptional regulator, anaerobic regulatory protein